MARLGFKEYYESKKRLLSAAEDSPRIREEYELLKYCKFPVYESLDDDHKTYLAFKPKDRIEVLWEHVSNYDEFPVAKCLRIISEDGDDHYYPSWNNVKMTKWVNSNTRKLSKI